MPQDQGSVCPICNDTYLTTTRPLESGMTRFSCKRCGSFDMDYVLISARPWKTVKHLLSAWVRRENKRGVSNPVIAKGADYHDISSPEWWNDQFGHMGFPTTTSEKLDELLVAYGKEAGENYDASISPAPHLIAEIAAVSFREVVGLTKLLAQLDYLLLRADTNEGIYKISAKGWLRIEELRKTSFASNNAFVAMWFNEITADYRKAVIAAINHCDFKPVIIDQQEYNDFVMNQVIASIKQSRFLVADFTSRPEIEKDGIVKNGVRGGVYWEAGMAYGLGVPVIHTSEDNAESRNRIHFDVNQYNTIFWKTDELGVEIRSLDQTRTNPNFPEKLAARILSTIGRGTYSPASR